MKITTKTGAVYTINDHGILQKTTPEGDIVSTYKIFSMKAVPNDVDSWDAVHALPEGNPEIGKRLYTAGREDHWLSTEVVSIEGELPWLNQEVEQL